MDKNDHVFDPMAAAEESIKHMDSMFRQIPELIQTALADEYCKSPWMTEVPKTMERFEKTIAEWRKANIETQQSNRQLRQMYWASIGVFFLMCCGFLALVLMGK